LQASNALQAFLAFCSGRAFFAFGALGASRTFFAFCAGSALRTFFACRPCGARFALYTSRAGRTSFAFPSFFPFGAGGTRFALHTLKPFSAFFAFPSFFAFNPTRGAFGSFFAFGARHTPFALWSRRARGPSGTPRAFVALRAGRTDGSCGSGRTGRTGNCSSVALRLLRRSAFGYRVPCPHSGYRSGNVREWRPSTHGHGRGCSQTLVCVQSLDRRESKHRKEDSGHST
jgi:hypothetical protein